MTEFDVLDDYDESRNTTEEEQYQRLRAELDSLKTPRIYFHNVPDCISFLYPNPLGVAKQGDKHYHFIRRFDTEDDGLKWYWEEAFPHLPLPPDRRLRRDRLQRAGYFLSHVEMKLLNGINGQDNSLVYVLTDSFFLFKSVTHPTH